MTVHEQPSMSASPAADRFVALPDEETLARTATALEARGFGVEGVDGLDDARNAVLGRIPADCPVMTFPSVTLEETGIAQALADSERYGSLRDKVWALDRETQMQEIKAIMVVSEVALGSVHAVTHDGTLVLASALGSQIAAHAWGAAQVILVVGAQKLVPDLDAARARIYEHSLPLEDARAREVYGAGSRVGKLLEIHQEEPGRIHVVLIRQRVGF